MLPVQQTKISLTQTIDIDHAEGIPTNVYLVGCYKEKVKFMFTCDCEHMNSTILQFQRLKVW